MHEETTWPEILGSLLHSIFHFLDVKWRKKKQLSKLEQSCLALLFSFSFSSSSSSSSSEKLHKHYFLFIFLSLKEKWQKKRQGEQSRAGLALRASHLCSSSSLPLLSFLTKKNIPVKFDIFDSGQREKGKGKKKKQGFEKKKIVEPLKEKKKKTDLNMQKKKKNITQVINKKKGLFFTTLPSFYADTQQHERQTDKHRLSRWYIVNNTSMCSF